MYLLIEQNPNCEPVDGRVFQERTPARAVAQVRRSFKGRDIWRSVTGLDPGMKERPASALKVDDSGEGTCYLVVGGAWGLRFQDADARRPWSLDDPTQWGESFLLLAADGNDIRFAD